MRGCPLRLSWISNIRISSDARTRGSFWWDSRILVHFMFYFPSYISLWMLWLLHSINELVDWHWPTAGKMPYTMTTITTTKKKGFLPRWFLNSSQTAQDTGLDNVRNKNDTTPRQTNKRDERDVANAKKVTQSFLHFIAISINIWKKNVLK